MEEVKWPEWNECTVPNCQQMYIGVSHVLIFRSEPRHDRHIVYSCAGCICEALVSKKMPIDTVLSLRKKTISVWHWVEFAAKWISDCSWNAKTSQKVFWEEPFPWQDESLHDVLVTETLSTLKTREQIIQFAEEQRKKRPGPKAEEKKEIQFATEPLQLSYLTKDPYADINIILYHEGGLVVTYHCHKILLAQNSAYFRTLTTCEMKEKQTNTVEFRREGNFMPSWVTKYLDWVYFKKFIPVGLQRMDIYIELANRFMDDGLRKRCIQELEEHIDEPQAFILAESHGLNEPVKKFLDLICQTRDFANLTWDRCFDAFPESTVHGDRWDLEHFSPIHMKMLLEGKINEMNRTSERVRNYALQISAILDQIQHREGNLEEYSDEDEYVMRVERLPERELQSIRALLVKMVGSTSCSDSTFMEVGQKIATVQGIQSRSIECGPCSECGKMDLGARDYWRVHPLKRDDVPGTYLCGECYKNLSKPKSQKRKTEQMSNAREQKMRQIC